MYRWSRNRIQNIHEHSGEAFSAFKRIAQTKTSGSVGGVKIDPVIATAVVTAHQNLSPTHAQSLAAMPADALAQFGQSLIKQGMHKESVNECFLELIGEEEEDPYDFGPDPAHSKDAPPDLMFGDLAVPTGDSSHWFRGQHHPELDGEEEEGAKVADPYGYGDAVEEFEMNEARGRKRQKNAPYKALKKLSRTAVHPGVYVDSTPRSKMPKAELPTGKTAAQAQAIGKGWRSTRRDVSIAGDAKTVKGQKKNWATAIQYFSPAGAGGVPDYCPHASPGCRDACLFHSGQMGIQAGKWQIERTMRFAKSPKKYVDGLKKSVAGASAWAKKQGMNLAVRLNGTSDIPWERTPGSDGNSVIHHHSTTQFYDYTKNPSRMQDNIDGKHPKNYHLTFSRDERPESHTHSMNFLRQGGNVAAVFDVSKTGGKLPDTYMGHRVINGDETDLRFLDHEKKEPGHEHKGVWVGLTYKPHTGKGVKRINIKKGAEAPSHSGFVIHDAHLNP